MSLSRLEAGVWNEAQQPGLRAATVRGIVVFWGLRTWHRFADLCRSTQPHGRHTGCMTASCGRTGGCCTGRMNEGFPSFRLTSTDRHTTPPHPP
ncbi:hypothetical protein DSO57_1039349 [Entomophthora muscae]|uniref:Uncharacterized protein n=1 Tax=Entomophthora muscae TaxID=34485 RepID=A0ACC2UJ99_9FUNG|nr:hypothetical protein DSO57_1039349 [Entomophthora muscae]